MGILPDFFERLDKKNICFKIWVKVGNSGMFRPEMLRLMGLHEDIRPTMILYGIDDIRDLLGPKVDLSLIKRNPICRIGIKIYTFFICTCFN
ncbi:hypothetical protein MKX03_035786 [Papaver bracteatum]|nr:hypothetical protein MKX03_035786 [Papaver bracteatum]